jgi:hypothetical protein
MANKKKITKGLSVIDEKELAPIMEENRFALGKSWLSEKQTLKILQKTPQEHRFTRQGKGGTDFEYVTGVYIQKVLNYVFGWNWDFEIIKQECIGLETGRAQVITTGKLIVKSPNGHTVSKMQNGRSDVKFLKANPKQPLDLGNDYKASATDCFKKCASMLGIASDVYGKNEFKEIKEPEEPKIKPEKNIDKSIRMIQNTDDKALLSEYIILIKKDPLLTQKEKDMFVVTINNKINAKEITKS